MSTNHLTENSRPSFPRCRRLPVTATKAERRDLHKQKMAGKRAIAGATGRLSARDAGVALWRLV